MIKKAVVLLSGGLDSAVTLYWARSRLWECRSIAFRYGQRHAIEVERARSIASRAGSDIKVVDITLPWKGSSLVDKSERLPQGRTIAEIKRGIPSTYVPARNTIFLGIAASYAEAIGAGAIFIGAHSEDSSGYPDCRKPYLEAFDKALRLGTKRGVEGRLMLKYPLIDKSKSDIIRLGRLLGVPFELTRSCYKGGERPCMKCDSCVLRAKGFKEAGFRDPITISRP